MATEMKLELGAGHRGTRGYIHHDAYPFPGIDLVCPPWELPFQDGELDEVLALAFIEHLTYYEALDTFREVHRVLKPGGEFVFDVPDYPKWAAYYCWHMHKGMVALAFEPPDLAWCRRTLFGWQRWPGDEHKYGWDQQSLVDNLRDFRFQGGSIRDGQTFLNRGLYRKRFSNSLDAHLYVVAIK